MSEKTAYQALRKGIRMPGDRIDRIENLVGTGFPDTNMCLSGKEVWVEIKAPKEPKRKSTPLFGSNHKLSQEQKNWFLAQHNAKGRGFIYIETDKCRMLIHQVYADCLNEMAMFELVLKSSWCSSRRTTKQEWLRLRDTLRGVLLA